MYEAPKLVRFGTFRELTLQSSGKTVSNLDLCFPFGQDATCSRS